MARKLYLGDFSHKRSAGFRKFVGDEKNGETREIISRGNKEIELLKIFQSAIEKSGGDEGETLARVQKGLKDNRYFANSDVRQIMDEAKRSGYFISNRSFSVDESATNQPSVIRPRAAYRLKNRKADLNRIGSRGLSVDSSRIGQAKNNPQSVAPVTRNRPMF